METSQAKFKDKEDLWENIKRNNLLCVTEISEEEREHRAKEIFEAIGWGFSQIDDRYKTTDTETLKTQVNEYQKKPPPQHF